MPPPHKVISYETFITVITQSQTYSVSALLEYKDRNDFGVVISVWDKRIAWGNEGAIYYTHFHAHEVNAKDPAYPITHFKEGRSKFHRQGWDLKKEPSIEVLKILRKKDLQKEKWVRLN